VEKLNGLVKDTELANDDLAGIIKNTAKDPEKSAIFNNAAQAWNHAFYWQSMRKGGGGTPKGAIANKINADFGSFEKFTEEFKNAALTQFGSGWAWLVIKDRKLAVMNTSNADTPLAHGITPLLTVDVWEHAYYLDYQNKRVDYIEAFINHLINWDFAESNIGKK
jgi:Fe-Mn family superoxide dismutase